MGSGTHSYLSQHSIVGCIYLIKNIHFNNKYKQWIGNFSQPLAWLKSLAWAQFPKQNTSSPFQVDAHGRIEIMRNCLDNCPCNSYFKICKKFKDKKVKNQKWKSFFFFWVYYTHIHLVSKIDIPLYFFWK